MLAISLFFICYTLLINQIILTGYIVRVPHFSKTAMISGYLVMPFLFVYIRNTFYPGKLWNKKDWWLLAPVIFYIIDLLPFFLLSGQEKAKILPSIFTNAHIRMRIDEGWITPFWVHYVLMYGMAAMLWVITIKMIVQNHRMEGDTISRTNKPLFGMIIMLAISYAIMTFPGLFGAVLGTEWFNQYFIAFSLAIPLLGVAIFLAFSPQVLYGFVYKPSYLIAAAETRPKEEPKKVLVSGNNQSVELPVNEPSTIQKQADEDRWEMEIIYARIDQYMNEKKPFLIKSLSIHDLSLETEVPVYTISKVINSLKGLNFNKWLNQYRISYFIKLYQIPGNHQLTLEALAQKAGFVSRVTFIKNFKDEMNETPSHFIKSRFKKELI